LTIFSEKFLPEQFLRDSAYFELRIDSKVSGYTDSFQTIANLYSTLGINRTTTELKIIEWGIFFVALLLSRSNAKVGKNSKQLLLLSTFYLMLLPFYGSLFTKEILIVLLLTIYLILKKMLKNKYNLVLIIFFQFTIFVLLRQYYAITLGFTVFYFLIGKYKNRFIGIYPVIIIGIFSTLNSQTGVITALTGVNVFQIRNITNESLEIIARSKIEQNPPSGNLIYNLINTLHVTQQILFPYKLLGTDLYEFFTFLTVLIVNFILLRNYFLQIEKSPTPEASFLFAFFSTAIIFEPDLGSYVRHGFVFALISMTLLNYRHK
jgi:hypothetical protein